MPLRRAHAHAPATHRPQPSARTVALRYLARRDYTTGELTSKLLARGLEEADVAQAIADLASLGYLDDRRAAAAHVRTAARIKGRGPRRIQLELEARGVDAETARHALAEITPEDVDQAIRKVVDRRHPTRPIPADARTRLFQHLLRRGFPSDAIRRALGRHA